MIILRKEYASESTCQWYEEGEKPSKSLLNFEKLNGMETQIRKIIVNDQEVTDPNKILF